MKIARFWPWMAALVALSFVRENFFLVLNGAMNGKGSYKANIPIPEFLYSEFSLSQLSMIKNAAVLLFVALFAILTILSIDKIFKQKAFRKTTFIIWFSLLGISILFLALNTLLELPVFYTLFIKSSHLVQSPIPAFILIPVFHFYQKFSTIN